jgi:hypothetical protein
MNFNSNAAGAPGRTQASKTNYNPSIHPIVKPEHGGKPITTADGKTIGYLRAGGVLHRKIRGSRHFLRSPFKAISLDVFALKSAIRQGCTIVKIEDEEDGKFYETDVWNYNQNAIPIDRGFGEQMALSLEHFTITDPRHKPAKPLQPSIFERGRP